MSTAMLRTERLKEAFMTVLDAPEGSVATGPMA